jgi:hypothetical protein
VDTSPEELRASDADRERVAEVLREAHADGRLEPDEYQSRLDQVFAARTLGDLAPLTRDLLTAEQQPIQLRSEPVAALFRKDASGGRWVVPARHTTLAAFGTVELDLRQALLAAEHVRLDVSAIFGRVHIRVPDGVEVRVRGRTFLGRRTATGSRLVPTGAPVLEVEGLSLLGSVVVETPKHRRSWLPWRRRRE